MPKRQIFDNWETIDAEGFPPDSIESCRCDTRHCVKDRIYFGRVETDSDGKVRQIPEDIYDCKKGKPGIRTLKFETGETLTYLPNWKDMVPNDDTPELCSCPLRSCFIEIGQGIRRDLDEMNVLEGSVFSCEVYLKHLFSLPPNQLKEFLSQKSVSIPRVAA